MMQRQQHGQVTRLVCDNPADQNRINKMSTHLILSATIFVCICGGKDAEEMETMPCLIGALYCFFDQRIDQTNIQHNKPNITWHRTSFSSSLEIKEKRMAKSEDNFSGALDRRYSFESAESPNFFNF